MKTYLELKDRFGFVLPKWYTEETHLKVQEILNGKGGKLLACKNLREMSNVAKTFDNSSKELFLHDAKALVDFICDGTSRTLNEDFARRFSIWAWGKEIPTEVSELQAFVSRFMDEQKITITSIK